MKVIKFEQTNYLTGSEVNWWPRVLVTDTDFEIASRIINDMENFEQFFQVLLTFGNGEFGIVHYNIVVYSFTLSKLI